MKKIAISMLIVTMLVAPMVVPVFAGVADVPSWYFSTDGVLSTDQFYAYPFYKRDLKLGFSKFGEKVNPFTTPARGLQYNGPVTSDPKSTGADPFANPGVLMGQWIEGWWLGFVYEHRTLGTRRLWAWAMFSDFTDWGSPAAGDYVAVPARVTTDGWIRYKNTVAPGGSTTNSAPQLEPHGGRKTNAKVITDDVVVLYDGPREYIALVKHTLYDQSIAQATAGGAITESGPNIPVLRFTILIEFNKVKKYVIQKKDVKLLLDDKTMSGDKAWLELRNSGQWDLGTTQHYRSYAHFYTDGDGSNEALNTVYDQKYHQPSAADWLTPCTGYGMQWPNVPPGGPATELWGKYAKAQIISSTTAYVGWTAFWPHPSYWTVDGFTDPFSKWGKDISGKWVGYATGWSANEWRHDDIQAPRTEPDVPFVGGEWDFIFSISQNIYQFRGVTTYGVTDKGNADDLNMGGAHVNTLADEVVFQNNEVFNPYDLNKAVHKTTSRHVEYFSGDPFTTTGGSATEPVVDTTLAQWKAYCSFAERVIYIPRNVLLVRGVDYTWTFNAGTGQATIDLASGSEYEYYYYYVKVLYSVARLQTNPVKGAYEWITVGTNSAPIDATGAAMVSEAFDSRKDIEVVKAALDFPDGVNDPTDEVPYLFKLQTGAGMGGRAPTRTDYMDSLGRVHLLNDFCTKNAIKTSNIIYIGGPLVNLGTYFMNDFAPALYGLSDSKHAVYPDWAGRVIAAECWSRNTFAGMGYAVISVYKDIDGSVHLGIWGATGVDTYYACMWFWTNKMSFTREKDYAHGTETISLTPGIVYLQTENSGVVSIILKFDYTKKYYDTGFCKLIERLGTISEKWPHDP